MATIELRNLTKRYDDVDAVTDATLDVRDGEFLVLVGPSGCGKSTTLRMIAGLEDVTEGTLRIGGESVTDVPPEDRSIAMVFQNYALYPHMTAAENMRFGMKSNGDFADAEIDERVADAAETLDIEDLLDRKPKALSGGERQRVAIGRALVREPDVFLLDEPLSNLDAKLRVEMRAELLKLHRELDATTVYVTHDQTEAMTLGDRVAVMNDGQIQQVAPPQALYDYPESRFVAEFIGEPAMNVVPVKVRARDGGYAAVHDGFTVTLPDRRGVDAASNGHASADGSGTGSDRSATDGAGPAGSAAGRGLDDAAGSVASLGVRPEDVSLASNLPAGAETFDAEVTVREPLGESLLLHCLVGGDELQVKVEPRTEIRPGDTVEIGFDDERLHLFDAASGAALYHSTPRERARTEPTTPE